VTGAIEGIELVLKETVKAQVIEELGESKWRWRDSNPRPRDYDAESAEKSCHEQTD
jgi:hypothetical protein